MPEARAFFEAEREHGSLHASEVTRIEILAGMRPAEEADTRAFLSAFVWHTVDELVAERAGALARQWLPSHGNIDVADLVVAATAQETGLPLYTLNLRHFPSSPRLSAPTSRRGS